MYYIKDWPTESKKSTESKSLRQDSKITYAIKSRNREPTNQIQYI